MVVSVACPDCDATFPVSEALLGKKMKCKACQATFVAEAAKVKVGAGAPTATKPTARRSATPSVPAPSSSGPPLTLIGGGIALAVMIGVTVWALAFRDTGGATTDNNNQYAANTGNGSRVTINDTATAEEPKAKVTPKAEAKAVEVAVDKPKTGPAWFAATPRNLPFTIAPDTVEKLKRSSAWIKTDNGTGSGWCAEPGIFITNAHVMGMKEPAAPPPKSVSIVLNPGLPDEKLYPAEMLGLDRENDLCVLRIKGDKLPDPMPICRSSELSEGQRLYTVGFPFGNRFEKGMSDETGAVQMRVKVRQTAVAGRFTMKTGSIKYVQVEGGADPGNSGGMIVDTSGNVRCVLVAGLPGTNLRFTIPSEYSIYLLQGRMLSCIPGQPYQIGEKVRQPFRAFIADPMKRISKTALEIWTGEPGKKVRPASDTAPNPLPGDSTRLTIEFPYDAKAKVDIGEAHEVSAETDLPHLPEGHAYWIQPRYVGIDGKTRWGEAVVLNAGGVPVERKPANLAIRHQKDAEHAIDLESHFAVGATPEGGELHLRDQGMIYALTEKTMSVQPDGTAKVTLKYNDLRFTDEDTQHYVSTQIKGLMAMAKGMMTEMMVTKSGRISKPKMDFAKVPVPVRPFMERFNVQTVQSLEALALALPDREVQPGDTWQQDSNYTVIFSRIAENALFKMNYRYMGTRVRAGREEAVVEFDGKIVRGEGNEVGAPPPPASKGDKGKGDTQSRLAVRNMYGIARGAALVDLSTGLVTMARNDANMEFDVPFAGQGNLKFGLGMRVILHRHLQRAVTAGARPDPLRLLPNQVVVLSPFVGAPDISLSHAP